MLLAIDVGNTQTHLGAFRGDELAEHWRFRDRRRATGDEIARADRRPARRSAASSLDDVEALVVSSVVPPLGGQYEAMASATSARPACWSGPGVKTGMPIRIDNPHEVGADRLVNAVAAYERIGGACIVVDFGTGDQLRRGLGRRRVPRRRRSPPASRSRSTALAERGARIPTVELAEPEAAIGKSTRGAIQSASSSASPG